MNDELLSRKLKRKSLYKAVFAIPFMIAGIYLIIFLQNNGLLSLDGYFSPVKVQNSLNKVYAIASKPLALSTFSVSLAASPDNLIDAGIEETRNGVRVSNYLAVYVDGKYILCLISKSKYDSLKQGEGYTFTGTLKKLESDVTAMVIDDMVKANIKAGDATKMLYGYYIDTESNGIFQRTILCLFVLFVWAAAFYLAIRGILPLFNIYNYPEVKKLCKYGDVQTVFPEIEQQFAYQHEQSKFGMKRIGHAVYLLGSWIIVESPFALRFMRANDLLWAYKMKNTTKYYGVININTSYSARLFSKAKIISVPGDEGSVEKLLSAVVQLYPWTIVGYSDALETIWNTDIGQFITNASKSGANGSQASPSSADEGDGMSC